MADARDVGVFLDRAQTLMGMQHAIRLLLCIFLLALVGCSDGAGPSDQPKLSALQPVSPTVVTANAGSQVTVVLRALDARGRRIPGVTVHFDVVAPGGGSVEPAAAVTNASGEATAQWTLGALVGEQFLEARAAPATAVSFRADVVPTPAARAFGDRPDDFAGPQVHAMYVVPSDGIDRGLDVGGDIAISVASFQLWLAQRTGGRSMRMDTHGGALDVTFHRLTRTDAAMQSFGAFVVTQIEAELRQAGKLRSDKRYILYYEGGSTHACGGAAWPPSVPGQSAAMYLHGLNGFCTRPFVPLPTSEPGYWEFAMLHDLVHTLGIVSRDAPSHTGQYPAHVPEPQDLMYTGTAPWAYLSGLSLDVGVPDYFGSAVPAHLPNLQNSVYLGAASPAILRMRVTPLSEEMRVQMGAAAAALPVHPPFDVVQNGGN